MCFHSLELRGKISQRKLWACDIGILGGMWWRYISPWRLDIGYTVNWVIGERELSIIFIKFLGNFIFYEVAAFGFNLCPFSCECINSLFQFLLQECSVLFNTIFVNF